MKLSLKQIKFGFGLVALTMFAIGCSGVPSNTNNQPAINSLRAEKYLVAPSGSSEVRCVATDADGDSLTFTWSATGGSFSGTGSVTTWMAPDVPGTYTLTVTVTDGRGGKATMPLAVDVQGNHTPVIESLTAKSAVVGRAGSTEVECIVSDRDGDKLSYRWTATGGSISGEDSVVTWTAPEIEGKYALIVTVTDGRGGEATTQLSIYVGGNYPPVIEALTGAGFVKQATSTEIECIASDQDGDELSYQWTATGGSISGEGPIVTWTAPMACSSYVITVTVADGRGGEVSEELRVTVIKPG